MLMKPREILVVRLEMFGFITIIIIIVIIVILILRRACKHASHEKATKCTFSRISLDIRRRFRTIEQYIL